LIRDFGSLGDRALEFAIAIAIMPSLSAILDSLFLSSFAADTKAAGNSSEEILDTNSL